MSLSNILKATAAMVMEAKMDAIDMFVEYMKEKIEVDDEFMELVRKFKNTVNEDNVELSAKKSAKKKAQGDEGGRANGAAKVKNVVERKRPPTAYHVFMSETSARLREENPDMSKKEVQDEAKKLWKEKKEAEPKVQTAKKSKKAKAKESEESSETASASDRDETATADDSGAEDVVQRIQAAAQKEKKRKAPAARKKKVAELADELSWDAEDPWNNAEELYQGGFLN